MRQVYRVVEVVGREITVYPAHGMAPMPTTLERRYDVRLMPPEAPSISDGTVALCQGRTWPSGFYLQDLTEEEAAHYPLGSLHVITTRPHREEM